MDTPKNEEEMKQELERLRQENETLKRKNDRELTMKVSEKGALSVYGLGRFPVTLYKEQWLRLLTITDKIHQFIAQNEAKLKTRS